MKRFAVVQVRRQARWVAGLALSLACCVAAAQKPPDITAGELALLPPYCPDTQTMSATDPRGSEKAARWVSVLGPAFWGLHHYCWGLIHVMRAGQVGMPQQMRRWHYETAINDYRYVLANAQSDFVLQPEIYLRIGEAYLELQVYANAMEAFQRSRDAKPDYWPAYVRMATLHERLGKHAEALTVLREGMAKAPNQRALIEAYKRMGGDYAKFVATQSPAPAASGPVVAASGSTP